MIRVSRAGSPASSERTAAANSATAAAATKIERWRPQQLDGDAVALRQVIEAADRADYMGARFHNLVVDQIRRHMAALQLPLPPVATKRPRYG